MIWKRNISEIDAIISDRLALEYHSAISDPRSYHPI